MLVRRSFLLCALAFAWGCGDGVGNPILGDGLLLATSGGASGAGAGGADAGGAGSGGAGSGGAGSGGADSGGAGSAGTLASDGGAGSGGVAAAGTFGGGGAGTGGTGPKPPWDGGSGGDASGQAGWMNLPPPGGAPDAEHCASVSSSNWEEVADRSEREFFDALNATRFWGMRCGVSPPTPDDGSQVPPIAFSPALRCSARLHSRDMSDNGYFDTVSLEGVGPEDRMRQAGAEFRTGAETIGLSMQPRGELIDPYEVFTRILAAGGSQCQNLMDPGFVWVGIGVYRDHITLDFSGP